MRTEQAQNTGRAPAQSASRQPGEAVLKIVDQRRQVIFTVSLQVEQPQSAADVLGRLDFIKMAYMQLNGQQVPYVYEVFGLRAGEAGRGRLGRDVPYQVPTQLAALLQTGIHGWEMGVEDSQGRVRLIEREGQMFNFSQIYGLDGQTLVLYFSAEHRDLEGPISPVRSHEGSILLAQAISGLVAFELEAGHRGADRSEFRPIRYTASFGFEPAHFGGLSPQSLSLLQALGGRRKKPRPAPAPPTAWAGQSSRFALDAGEFGSVLHAMPLAAGPALEMRQTQEKILSSPAPYASPSRMGASQPIGQNTSQMRLEMQSATGSNQNNGEMIISSIMAGARRAARHEAQKMHAAGFVRLQNNPIAPASQTATSEMAAAILQGAQQMARLESQKQTEAIESYRVQLLAAEAQMANGRIALKMQIERRASVERGEQAEGMRLAQAEANAFSSVANSLSLDAALSLPDLVGAPAASPLTMSPVALAMRSAAAPAQARLVANRRIKNGKAKPAKLVAANGKQKQAQKVQAKLKAIRKGKGKKKSADAPIRALLFDLDGTLADSEELHRATFNAIFSRFGLHIGKKEWLARYTGTGSEHIISDMKRRHRFGEPVKKLVDERAELFMKQIQAGRLRPMAGAKEWVKWAQKNGLKVVVASGGHRSHIQKQLKSIGLEGLPFVGSEDVKRPKPYPDSFLAAARKAGVSPSECLAVEDSAAGLGSAREAGMRCLLIGSHHPPAVRKKATVWMPRLNPRKAIAWLNPKRAQ